MSADDEPSPHPSSDETPEPPPDELPDYPARVTWIPQDSAAPDVDARDFRANNARDRLNRRLVRGSRRLIDFEGGTIYVGWHPCGRFSREVTLFYHHPRWGLNDRLLLERCQWLLMDDIATLSISENSLIVFCSSNAYDLRAFHYARTVHGVCNFTEARARGLLQRGVIIFCLDDLMATDLQLNVPIRFSLSASKTKAALICGVSASAGRMLIARRLPKPNSDKNYLRLTFMLVKEDRIKILAENDADMEDPKHLVLAQDGSAFGAISVDNSFLGMSWDEAVQAFKVNLERKDIAFFEAQGMMDWTGDSGPEGSDDEDDAPRPAATATASTATAAPRTPASRFNEPATGSLSNASAPSGESAQRDPTLGATSPTQWPAFSFLSGSDYPIALDETDFDDQCVLPRSEVPLHVLHYCEDDLCDNEAREEVRLDPASLNEPWMANVRVLRDADPVEWHYCCEPLDFVRSVLFQGDNFEHVPEYERTYPIDPAEHEPYYHEDEDEDDVPVISRSRIVKLGNNVTSFDVDPTGSLFVVGYDTGHIELFDSRANAVSLSIMKILDSPCLSVGFAPGTGNIVVAGQQPGAIRYFLWRTRQMIGYLSSLGIGGRHRRLVTMRVQRMRRRRNGEPMRHTEEEPLSSADNNNDDGPDHDESGEAVSDSEQPRPASPGTSSRCESQRRPPAIYGNRPRPAGGRRPNFSEATNRFKRGPHRTQMNDDLLRIMVESGDESLVYQRPALRFREDLNIPANTATAAQADGLRVGPGNQRLLMTDVMPSVAGIRVPSGSPFEALREGPSMQNPMRLACQVWATAALNDTERQANIQRFMREQAAISVREQAAHARRTANASANAQSQQKANQQDQSHQASDQSKGAGQREEQPRGPAPTHSGEGSHERGREPATEPSGGGLSSYSEEQPSELFGGQSTVNARARQPDEGKATKKTDGPAKGTSEQRASEQTNEQQAVGQRANERRANEQQSIRPRASEQQARGQTNNASPGRPSRRSDGRSDRLSNEPFRIPPPTSIVWRAAASRLTARLEAVRNVPLGTPLPPPETPIEALRAASADIAENGYANLPFDVPEDYREPEPEEENPWQRELHTMESDLRNGGELQSDRNLSPSMIPMYLPGSDSPSSRGSAADADRGVREPENSAHLSSGSVADMLARARALRDDAERQRSEGINIPRARASGSGHPRQPPIPPPQPPSDPSDLGASPSVTEDMIWLFEYFRTVRNRRPCPSTGTQRRSASAILNENPWVPNPDWLEQVHEEMARDARLSRHPYAQPDLGISRFWTDPPNGLSNIVRHGFQHPPPQDSRQTPPVSPRDTSAPHSESFSLAATVGPEDMPVTYEGTSVAPENTIVTPEDTPVAAGIASAEGSEAASSEPAVSDAADSFPVSPTSRPPRQ